jgi:hypothetical protein
MANPKLTATSVAHDFLNAIKGSVKASTNFKTLIGFPSAKWADMESTYTEVMNAIPDSMETDKRARATLRQLMTWVRQNCDKPYEKSKKGILSARVAGKADTAKKPAAAKTDPVTMTDDLMLIRVGVLGNKFLTAEADRAALGRLITAITNSLHAATSGKK